MEFETFTPKYFTFTAPELFHVRQPLDCDLEIADINLASRDQLLDIIGNRHSRSKLYYCDSEYHCMLVYFKPISPETFTGTDETKAKFIAICSNCEGFVYSKTNCNCGAQLTPFMEDYHYFELKNTVFLSPRLKSIRPIKHILTHYDINRSRFLGENMVFQYVEDFVYKKHSNFDSEHGFTPTQSFVLNNYKRRMKLRTSVKLSVSNTSPQSKLPFAIYNVFNSLPNAEVYEGENGFSSFSYLFLLRSHALDDGLEYYKIEESKLSVMHRRENLYFKNGFEYSGGNCIDSFTVQERVLLASKIRSNYGINPISECIIKNLFLWSKKPRNMYSKSTDVWVLRRNVAIVTMFNDDVDSAAREGDRRNKNNPIGFEYQDPAEIEGDDFKSPLLTDGKLHIFGDRHLYFVNNKFYHKGFLYVIPPNLVQNAQELYRSCIPIYEPLDGCAKIVEPEDFLISLSQHGVYNVGAPAQGMSYLIP